jgi:hypothetical protein
MAEMNSPPPKPMPLTGMPDTLEGLNPPTDMDMRKGVKFGKMDVNPGRKESGK